MRLYVLVFQHYPMPMKPFYNEKDAHCVCIMTVIQLILFPKLRALIKHKNRSYRSKNGLLLQLKGTKWKASGRADRFTIAQRNFSAALTYLGRNYMPFI